MKRLAFFISFLLVSSNLLAQSDTEEIDFFQSIFGMEKKELVYEFVNPSPSTTVMFWSIYDEYEIQRKALGKERIRLLKSYVNDYKTLNDGQIDKIIADLFSLRKGNDKLIEKYYLKMKKSVSSVEAAEFYHIESYILSQIRVTILENIPTLGEK